MREFRSSGSVEGVRGNHDSYSDEDFIDERVAVTPRTAGQTLDAKTRSVAANRVAASARAV